jgi:hypothetical protein
VARWLDLSTGRSLCSAASCVVNQEASTCTVA